MKKPCWVVLRVTPGSSKEKIITAYEKRLEEMNFSGNLEGAEAVKVAYREALAYDPNVEDTLFDDENDEIENDNEENKSLFQKIFSVGSLVVIYTIIKLIMSFFED